MQFLTRPKGKTADFMKITITIEALEMTKTETTNDAVDDWGDTLKTITTVTMTTMSTTMTTTTTSTMRKENQRDADRLEAHQVGGLMSGAENDRRIKTLADPMEENGNKQTDDEIDDLTDRLTCR